MDGQSSPKSKSLRQIESRMASLEPGSLRYQILDKTRRFKSSWIELGQVLYTVYRDKHFKAWGYMSFEAYCQTELGIHKQTAGKLVHSYYFLEKNEPGFLKAAQGDSGLEPKNIPGYEAVNALRLAAKNKHLTQEDLEEIKKDVFEEGKEGREVKKVVGLRLRSLLEEEDPQKARQERRDRTLRRLVTTVRTLKKEVVHGRLVSDQTARQIEKLLELLDKELGAPEA